MTLAADLAAARIKARRCSVCDFYGDLTPEDRAEFDQWLADGLAVAELWQLCRENGLAVSRRWFAEHVSEHHVSS